MRHVRSPSKLFLAGSMAEVVFEPQQVVVQRVDEVGFDRVLDDRVPLLRDRGHVRGCVHGRSFWQE